MLPYYVQTWSKLVEQQKVNHHNLNLKSNIARTTLSLN